MCQKKSVKNGNDQDKKQSNGKLRKIKINKDIELTEKQQGFLKIALSKETDLMFCVGPAGTSKTYLSILSALELLNKKVVDSLLYIRSAVESSDSKIGFLPGEEAMKLEPYLRPLRDKLSEFLSKTEISYMCQNELVNSEHVGYARGQDWKHKAVVIDEAQNLTKKELLTLTTRSGENTKIFIIGDSMQSDIGKKSGFVEFYNMFNTSEAKDHKIQCFEFDETDIVRSELVKYIISTFMKHEQNL